MNEIEVPLRQNAVVHECLCILVWDGMATDDQYKRNRCMGEAASPDEPFCAECVAQGHDKLDAQVPLNDPMRQKR